MFVRLFTDPPGETVAGQDLAAQAPGGRLAAGGTAGAELRRSRAFLRADGYYDDGYGGLKFGVDSYDATRSDRDAGTSRGGSPGSPGDPIFSPPATAASCWASRPAAATSRAGIRRHLLAEDNAGTLYRTQFRGLALIDCDASL